jgi:photosystem II stability/assembly factor-like uncharacterized protein
MLILNINEKEPGLKNLILFILFIALLILSCENNDESGLPVIEAPSAIKIISGNNQTGYPNSALPDSLVIEISANKPEDLMRYDYFFKSNEYISWLPSKSYIKNSKLYISASWQLSYETTAQELKFYLTEKCELNIYPSNCQILDSLSFNASVRPPWIQVYSINPWSLYDMHFSDENHGIAVGDLPFSSGYLKTADGGLTWTEATNARNDLYQLSFCDYDTGIVVLTNNYAYFTNDGGQSFYQGEWSPSITGHQSSTDYFMQNSKTIFSVGTRGAITKSVDGGKSWNTYQGFSFINCLYSLTCPSQNVCYACGEVGKIVKTSDGGETWLEQEVMINNYLKTIYFHDVSNGFAAGQFGALIRTTDGGINWEIIQTGLRSTIIEIHFYTRDEGYFVSSGGAIEKTIDGGKTWTLINKDNYGVYDISKACFNGNSILSLQEGSIYRYDLSEE